jgi:hypothetical protein
MDITRVDLVMGQPTQHDSRRGVLRSLAAAGLALAAGGGLSMDGQAKSRGRTMTKTQQYGPLLCTDYDDPCDSAFNWEISTTGPFTLNFTADTSNCTALRIWFVVDGQRFGDSDGYVVEPGASTGPISEGALPGRHTIRIEIDGTGDRACPNVPGVRFEWSGTVQATVGIRKRKRR